MKWIEKAKNNIVFRTIWELVLRYFKDGVGRSGAELAYFFLLSFFPLLVFFSLLVGTFNLDANAIREMLLGVIPKDVLDIALSSIEFLNNAQMDGLMYTGLIVSLWSASRAVSCLTIAVNDAYRIRNNRHVVLQFLINIGFSAAMLVSIVAVIVILVSGRSLLFFLNDWINLVSPAEINAWHFLRFIPVTALFFMLLTFLYSIVPNRKIRFKQVMPGAILATVGWLVASIGLSFYVENMSRYSLLYGSIGAVIVLMLWLYLTGVVLVMGAQFNHVLYIVRDQHQRVRLLDSTQPLPRLQNESAFEGAAERRTPPDKRQRRSRK